MTPPKDRGAAPPHPRPVIGVSSCLLGAPVRYNGGHSRSRFLTDELGAYVDWLPICPEAEIGLGVPRQTLHLERAEAGDRVIAAKSRADHTDDLGRVADRHLAQLRRMDGYVLKNKSPSCGLFSLPVFNAEGERVDGRGRGVFAARLTGLFPELPVEEQGRLSDDVLREHFVERVFAHARLRRLFTSEWRPRDLVDFHSRQKLQLMAHTPEGYRAAGRIVARAGSDEPRRIEAEYTARFHQALATRTTRGKHVNALQHAFGMISSRLDDIRRHDMLGAMEKYRDGQMPLSLPMALIRHHCAAEGIAWVRDQTYLEPYPDELRLRNAVPV